jgi:hypothetical protein
MTQHKWLPSEPTPAMLEAVGSLSTLLTNCDSRYGAYKTIYNAMWKAAPEVEQPQRESFTVTRHEVREAMMYCEINYCEYPDAYTLDILKRLGIGVE